MIRAIETSYLGYRFRSRLEARWACFLTQAGVAFEYEPEGFETSAGRYLPDFYLPGLGEWLEIKPRIELVTQFDWERVAAFADGRNSIHVLVGQPWPTEYRFYDAAQVPTRFVWLACPTCGSACFSSLQRLPGEQRIWCQACELASPTRDGFAWAPSSTQLDGGAIGLAFIAARRARFEHGARP